MENAFRIDKVEIGKATYGGIKVINYSDTDNKLKIGSYCSIGGDVTFLLGAEHRLETFSSYPFRARLIEKRCLEAGSKGNIVLEDDVWVGHGAIIMSGITIGRGAVVAAGAVVTKNIPPYAIVGGVPAKVLRYRFSGNIINILKDIDFEKISMQTLENNLEFVYTKITDDNIDEIVRKLQN